MDKIQLKAVFNKIFSSRGGYHDYDSPEQNMGLIFDPLLRQLKNTLWIANRGLNKQPVIHIGLINNYELNAVVAKHENIYYIGVYKGCFYVLNNLFNRMMANPDILTQFGDTSQESQHEPLFNPHTKSVWDLFVRGGLEDYVMPKGMQRKAIAFFLTVTAISYLVLHENGHIVNGHLDFVIASKPKETSQAELCIDETSYSLKHGHDNKLISQVLEYDADAYGAARIADVMKFFLEFPEACLSSPNLVMSEYKQSLYLMSFAVYSMFRLSGADPNHILFSKGHPPAAFRSRSLVNLIILLFKGREKAGLYPEGFHKEYGVALFDSIIQVEQAFVRIAEEGEGEKGSHLAFSDEAMKQLITGLTTGWTMVRPMLVPFAYNSLVPAGGGYKNGDR